MRRDEDRGSGRAWGREGARGTSDEGKKPDCGVKVRVVRRASDTYLSVRTSLSNSSSVIVGDDMLWVATHSRVERAERSG